MITPPPYAANFSPFMGGQYQPIPQGLWHNFCSRATADAMLLECQKIDPEAKMYDICDPNSRLPYSIGRFPYPLIKTDPSSDVSCYVIFGAVPMKKDLPPAVFQEAAGMLADTKSGDLLTFIDTEAQNEQGHVGKGRLWAYVSLNDLTDAETFWADASVLQGNLAV